MADDKSKRGSPDNKRLNKGEKYEVDYAKSKRKATATKAAGKATAKRSAAAAKKTTTAKKAPTPAKKAAPKATAPAAKKAAAPGVKKAATPATRGAPNPPKGEKTAANTAPRTMKERDAVDLLTDDHLAVAVLFKQYEKLAEKKAPAGERESLARTICAMLKAHTTIEEEIFYPAARKAGVEEDLLDEADIEHASAKDLIAQIDASNPGDDHFNAKVKVLDDYVTHHVIEEQTEMFPKCRRAGMDLVALGARLEARKAELAPSGKEPAPPAPKGESGILSKLSDTFFNKS